MRNRDPEKVLEFFREIEDCLLIVEGKKDAKSLNTLGLTNILAINGRPLIEIVEKVARSMEKSQPGAEGSRGKGKYSDIIILTDFDREGRHIAGRLSRLLRAYKIHPNQRLRGRVMNFGFNKVEDIKMESILKIGERLRVTKSLDRKVRRGDDYVKVGSNVNKIRNKSVNKGKRRGGKARHHRSGVWSD